MKRKYVIVILIMSFLGSSCCFGNFWDDISDFFVSFVEKPGQMGAVFPSSRFLTAKITKYIKANNYTVKVLEVGAGTGSFTAELANKNVFVDVIECNPRLVRNLVRKFGDNAKINIHCISILDWNPCYKYDFIISGLPFNSKCFDERLVDGILNKYKQLIKADGMISYFEYFGASLARKLFSCCCCRDDGEDDDNSSEDSLLTVQKFREQFQLDYDFVIVNAPPALVYHLQIG